MLAQTADTVDEAIERLSEAGFEFKLDGARIQVHKGGEAVKIFSRQLQEVTDRLPEIVEWTRALPAAEIILEEAIALRPDGTPQPFQMTMRRFGRMKNIEAMRREIPLTSFFLIVSTGKDARFYLFLIGSDSRTSQKSSRLTR